MKECQYLIKKMSNRQPVASVCSNECLFSQFSGSWSIHLWLILFIYIFIQYPEIVICQISYFRYIYIPNICILLLWYYYYWCWLWLFILSLRLFWLILYKSGPITMRSVAKKLTLRKRIQCELRPAVNLTQLNQLWEKCRYDRLKIRYSTPQSAQSLFNWREFIVRILY